MVAPVANALVLRGVNGSSFTLTPTVEGRMELEIRTLPESGAAMITQHSFDRGTTALIAGFLSAWVEESFGLDKS